MIIWGYRTRLTKSSVEDILKNSCPGCGGDLVLHDLKKWFTLYFIPIFPFSTIESCYKCEKCEQTYKQEIKKIILSSKKEKAKVQEDVTKMFVKALAACMTHMAMVDGKMSKEEKNEIDRMIKSMPNLKGEIEKTVEQVKKSKTDDVVFEILRQAREVLTAQGVMLIIAQIARVLLADGKIDKKEENLMKEYLLICGVPKGTYHTIIDKVREGMKK